MCVRSRSSRRTSPFSVMICRSFSAVVYAVGRPRESTSWTCRTVLGPRSQSTRRIASSASVGRGWASSIAVRRAHRSLRTSSYLSTKIFVLQGRKKGLTEQDGEEAGEDRRARDREKGYLRLRRPPALRASRMIRPGILDDRCAAFVGYNSGRPTGIGVLMEPGTYAKFDTTEGSFTIRLFDKEAPNTVANFVGLAEGTKEWSDPGDRREEEGALLRRHHLPPGDRGLHDPGRRPARPGDGRTGLHLRGRIPSVAPPRPRRDSLDGERRARHQRQPVLHHAGPHAAPRQPAFGVRRSGVRPRRGQADRRRCRPGGRIALSSLS